MLNPEGSQELLQTIPILLIWPHKSVDNEL